MSPTPKPRRWVEQLGHPWRTVSLSLFFALHRITAKPNERYPCAAMRDKTPFAGDAIEALLARTFTTAPLDANDGIVPLRSQLWGNVVWAGYGDHLDVLGHYVDKRGDDVPAELRHRDWLTSGSGFGDRELSALIDAVAAGMLTSSGNRSDPSS